MVKRITIFRTHIVFFLQMAALKATVAANIVDLIVISKFAHGLKAYMYTGLLAPCFGFNSLA